jgi:transposase
VSQPSVGEAQEAGRKVRKGTRWLLLKNPENLKAERNEQQRLHDALSLNQPLATASYLKEGLRLLWLRRTKKQASAFLADWIRRARSSGIRMLVSFAETLEKHRDGIFAYDDSPISTGPLEGNNNTIRTLQRQAYGYRDMAFFKLKIYALHNTKYALVG